MISVVHSRISQGWRASIEGTLFADHPVLSPTILASAQIVGECALIPLLPRWAVLFHGIKTFGRVIRCCRNRCAATVTGGVYPEVLTTPCGRNAAGGDGELKFFFSNWACAFAAVERRARDWSYAVEFLDFHGELIHKVFLTPESDLDAFRWWVNMHRAPHPGTGQGREQRSSGRVEGPAALCAGDARFLSKDHFRGLLRGFIESEVSLRISVANDGLIQSSSITPNRLKDDGVSIFLGNEKTGLQLRMDRLAEVSLHRSCSSSTWILKAYESEGFAACTFAPTRFQDSQRWEGLWADTE